MCFNRFLNLLFYLGQLLVLPVGNCCSTVLKEFYDFAISKGKIDSCNFNIGVFLTLENVRQRVHFLLKFTFYIEV